MTKRRYIDQHIRASENFACLTYRQRDLWLGLILTVDDQGRMPGHTAYVRSTVWPYDDVALEEVEQDLIALEAIGNIIRYRVDGRTFIQLVNWHKYQGVAEWMGASEYPAPEGWTDRARYHGKGNQIIILNWDKTGGFNSATLPLPSQLPTPLPCRDDDVNDDDEEEDDGEGEGELPAAAIAGGGGTAAALTELTNVGRVYVSNIGRITPIIQEELANLIGKYSGPSVIDAIGIAKKNGKPTLNYIAGILRKRADDDRQRPKRVDYSAFVER